MRICLIVDNPLRDLDGLVLLGWQLALSGADVFLVPMYEQGSDIPALRPDVVVANYVRPNNRAQLQLYRASGARIVVLDTEGAAGRTMDEFARLVSRMDCDGLIDAYLLWGTAQRDAFLRGGVLPPERIVVTGCPRYDFCAPPWRALLPAPADVARGFVLVNTNFPIVNPRFSRGSEAEVAAAIAVGFEPDHVNRYLEAAREACAAVRETIAKLAREFPGTQIVVRPHPFENPAAYSSLGAPNLLVRQVGTSLEWLNAASLLVHMNCSTSIEAVMLGCEPVSTEWLNSETLRLASFTGISRHSASFEELAECVRETQAGRILPVEPALAGRRRELIESLYNAADGKAGERACAAILNVAARGRVAPHSTPFFDRSLMRARTVMWGRRMLGNANARRLRGLFVTRTLEERRRSKSLDSARVMSLLARLNALDSEARAVTLRDASDAAIGTRAFGGVSLRLQAA